MKKEIWKPIEGYEGRYEVSNLGRVKSLDRKSKCKATPNKIIKGRPLKATSTNGYLCSRLSKGGITKSQYIHRLVAIAFIKNPEKKKQVNHKDGDKSNNLLSNLEWCTARENIQHSHRLGLSSNKGKLKGRKQLSKEDAKHLIKDLNKGINATVLALKYDVSRFTVYNIKAGRQWKSLTHLLTL